MKFNQIISRRIHLKLYTELGIPYYLFESSRHQTAKFWQNFEDFRTNIHNLDQFLKNQTSDNSKIDLISSLQKILPTDLKIALLFSGGLDSSLIAKLLVLNNNKVTGIYIGSEVNLNPKTRLLVSELGLSDLIIVDGVASTDVILNAIGHLPKGGTNLKGLAKLNEFVNLEKFDVLFHAQGADTLCNAVHNQKFKSKSIFINIFLHLILMARKKSWIFLTVPIFLLTLRLRKVFLSHNVTASSSIHFLLGVFVTHIPIDGGTLAQFSKIWNIHIQSPFHNSQIIDFFYANLSNPIQKSVIFQSLEQLNLGHHYFSKKGFKIDIREGDNLKVDGFELREVFCKKYEEFIRTSS
jgi:hypothetical protein